MNTVLLNQAIERVKNDCVPKEELIVVEKQGDSGLWLCYDKDKKKQGLFANMGDGHYFNVSGWDLIPPPKLLRSVGNCSLYLDGDRYVMKNSLTGSRHDISARPDITNEHRLSCHWSSFLDVHLVGLVMGKFNSADLKKAVRDAKEEERKAGADFCESGFQVLMIDANGERISGGPVGYHDGAPTLSMIKEYFRDFPDAVEMSIENQSRVYGEGNAIERRDNDEPYGWWIVSVYPANVKTLTL